MPLAVRALLLVLLALVPASLVQTMLERETRAERSAQIAAQASQLAQLIAGQQTRTLESVQHLLTAIAAHEAVRAAATNSECNDYLVRLLEQYPRFVALNSFDTQGHLVCTATPLPPGLTIADRPYFAAVMAGAPFAVGDFAQGSATGQRTLHLAAPLRDGAGTVVGGLVAGLSIDWLNQDLSTVQLPAGSAATILDRHGTVLARTPDPERFVGVPVPGFALAATPGGPRSAETSTQDGLDRIAALMPVAAAPDAIMVSVGLSVESGILQQLERERRAAMLVVGSLVIGLFLAIGAFHLGVDKPVQKLLRAAQAWSAQNWKARIGRVGGGREFDRIGNALDAMADALQKAELARLLASARVKALSDVSPQVVFTADGHGRIDWLNGYWRQFTGLGLARSRGAGLLRGVHPADRHGAGLAWSKAVHAAARTSEDPARSEFNRELRLRRAEDGAWRWFFCRAAPIRDAAGQVTSWAGVALDFHDLRQAREALAEQSERLRLTYESAPIGLCLIDPDLRFLAVNPVLAEFCGVSAEDHVGRSLREVSPHEADVLEPPLRRLFETGEPVEALEVEGEAMAPPALRRYWLCSYLPVRNAQGAIVAATGSVLDITARRHAEATERLLSREVDHRARNVLAVVRSMVRVSAAEAPNDVESFVEVLEGRIAAMARVHTLLSRAGWTSVELTELVRQETAVQAGQFQTEGGQIRLVPEAAQPLTMVLHELVTNAAKYGALCEATGFVRLRWWREADGVMVEWLERGGPPVPGPPSQTGFGTQLIDGNASTPLDGSLVRAWEPEGLRITLRIGAGAIAKAA